MTRPGTGGRLAASGLLCMLGVLGSTATAAGDGPADTSVAATPVASADLAQLDWLAGHWTSADGEEIWMAPQGGLMLAVTREIRRIGSSEAGAPARTRVSFEYLRIEQRDGTLVLQASPGGRPPTPFALAALGPGRVRFHNAAHDFPQSISYWREGGTLRARVEGMSDGRHVALEYAWTRARPEAGP